MPFSLFDSPPPIPPNDEMHWLLDDLGYPRGSSYWWRRYPERALEEHLKMVNGTNADYRFEGGAMIWTEKIRTDFGSLHDLKVVAGPYFPSVPPKGYAPGSDSGKHRFSDTSLCVAHPSEYSLRTSILDVRNLVCTWFFANEVHSKTGEWPTAEAD